MGDFGFWMFVLFATVLCAGEPDLLDAIIQYVHTLEACQS